MTLTLPLNLSESDFCLLVAGRVHAVTVVGAGDAAGREGLCKYILRPPIAQERLQLLDDGLVRIVLKRPFSDGMTCSQCLLAPRRRRDGGGRATFQRLQAADRSVVQTEPARVATTPFELV